MSLQESSCGYSVNNDIFEMIGRFLNVSFDRIPNVVKEDIVLQTLINSRRLFLQHPEYKKSQEIQEKVSTIESFISQLD